MSICLNMFDIMCSFLKLQPHNIKSLTKKKHKCINNSL